MKSPVVTLGDLEDYKPCAPSWRMGMMKLGIWSAEDEHCPRLSAKDLARPAAALRWVLDELGGDVMDEPYPPLSNKGRERTVTLRWIFDEMGLADCLWAMRALPAEWDGPVRLMLCDIAELALPYTDDPRCAEAIGLARAYARGEAARRELDAAREAARGAYYAAANAVPKGGAWAVRESSVAKAACEAAWAALFLAAPCLSRGGAAEQIAWAVRDAASYAGERCPWHAMNAIVGGFLDQPRS